MKHVDADLACQQHEGGGDHGVPGLAGIGQWHSGIVRRGPKVVVIRPQLCQSEWTMELGCSLGDDAQFAVLGLFEGRVYSLGGKASSHTELW